MTAPKSPQRAPKHLSRASAALWRRTLRSHRLEPHDVQLLKLLCEALDATEAARKVLAEDGTTFLDRFGCPKPRPEVAIERDSRIAAARLVRQLRLDEVPDDPDDPFDVFN